jgi:hypothetical protein
MVAPKIASKAAFTAATDVFGTKAMNSPRPDAQNASVVVVHPLAATSWDFVPPPQTIRPNPDGGTVPKTIDPDGLALTVGVAVDCCPDTVAGPARRTKAQDSRRGLPGVYSAEASELALTRTGAASEPLQLTDFPCPWATSGTMARLLVLTLLKPLCGS